MIIRSRRNSASTEFGLSPSNIGRALSETKAPFAFCWSGRIAAATRLRYSQKVMPPALARSKGVERLQQAVRLRPEIDKLERKLVTLLNGVPRNLLVRNDYGFTAAEMSKIAQSLHARAKERIASGRSKKFRHSVEKNI
jgi:hypothetical protein